MDRRAIPFAATSYRGGTARHPVTLAVPVRIRAEAHQAHPAFIEDTRTALVFSRGAVVPVGEPLDIGQSVLLTHRRTRQEIPCRVVYSKNHPGVKGYVELEFLRPAPNFWEIQFPYDDAMDAGAAPRGSSGGAVVNVPTPRAKLEAQSAEMEISTAPANVMTLADAVIPARRAPNALPVFGKESATWSPVTNGAPLVEDIETLLNRKAAACAAAEPEPFTFNLPLDDADVFSAAPPRRAFGSIAMLAAVAAGIVIVSLGAWQIVAGAQSEQAEEISLAEAPALRAPSTPEIKIEPRPAAAQSEVAPAGAAITAEAAAPPATSAPAPPVVEQGHSAPVPFARAKAEEAARAAADFAAKTNRLAEPPPLIRVMAPAAPLKARAVSADSTAPDAAVAAPNVPASFAAAPLGNLATKSAPPPVQGGRAVAPKLVTAARLLYPMLAKKSNIQGDVVIDALVDTKGRVSEMKAVSGPAMLHQAALESVAQWRYEPGTLNGQPVNVRVSVVVKFRLSGQ